MPSININLPGGDELSFVDLTFTINGQAVEGVTKVAWTTQREIQDIVGSGGKKFSRGRGSLKQEGTLTMLASSVMNLWKQSGGDISMLPPTQMILKWQPRGQALMIAIFSNLQFKGFDFEIGEGDLSKEVALPFVTSNISVQ